MACPLRCKGPRMAGWFALQGLRVAGRLRCTSFGGQATPKVPPFLRLPKKGLACLFFFLVLFDALAQVSQQQHGVQQLPSQQLILRRVLGANDGYLGG